MPDVNAWIGRWDGRPDWASPEQAESGIPRFTTELKKIIADEMKTRREPIVPEKVDILNVSHLASSDTKKVILHIHARPTLARLWNLPQREKAIALRVKQLLNLPEDEQCVSVNFKPVLKRFWAKA